MEHSREALQNVKNRLPHDPAFPLGIYLKKLKILAGKDMCTPMFIAALFIVVKVWNNPSAL